MRDESMSVQYKVGIFVIIGFIFFAISLFLLGGDSSIFVKYYRLQLTLQEVNGLNTGSVVSLSGVRVGNIEKMEFDPEKNSLVVQLRIDETFQNRIRKGSVGKTRTQGALGDKYIFIEPSELNNPILKDGEFLSSDSGPDLFTTLTNEGDRITKVFEILDEMHLLMKRINGNDRSEELMKNLTEASATMKVGMSSFKDTVAQTKGLILDIRKKIPENSRIEETVGRLANILAKLDRGEGTLGALINDPSIHNRIKEILGGSPRANHLKTLIQQTIRKGDSLHKGPVSSK